MFLSLFRRKSLTFVDLLNCVCLTFVYLFFSWKSIISRSFWAQVTENALSLATTPLTMATPAAADDPRADSGPALFQGSEHVLDVEHLPTAEDLWHCGRT